MTPRLDRSSPAPRTPWGASCRALARLWSVCLLAQLLNVTTGRSTAAGLFRLPTDNQALFEADSGPRFLAGTVGKPWTSGGFGCVRSEGLQFHEGLDIRAVHRTSAGEPADRVRATADGVVAYVNEKAGLSNYGRYVVVRHALDGLTVYSLYAHLSAFSPSLRAGQTVHAGETLGIMGRTSNTRQAISRDRAHVHFEINVLVNERFPEWYAKNFPDQRNDHGIWNGQNLLGMDPAALLQDQRAQGADFHLDRWIRSLKPMCRVLLRDADFSWIRRHRALIVDNPRARQSGIAGYELALAYNGLPVQAIPRSAAELKGKSQRQLLSVDGTEQKAHPCGKLVALRNGHWELAPRGQRLLDLLTY